MGRVFTPTESQWTGADRKGKEGMGVDRIGRAFPPADPEATGSPIVK
jgi:hypothetical protein